MPTTARYFGSLDLNLLREASINSQADIKEGVGTDRLSTSLSCGESPDADEREAIIHSVHTGNINVRIPLPMPQGPCADMRKECQNGIPDPCQGRHSGIVVDDNLPTYRQKHSFKFIDKGENGSGMLAFEDFLVKARDRVSFVRPFPITFTGDAT